MEVYSLRAKKVQIQVVYQLISLSYCHLNLRFIQERYKKDKQSGLFTSDVM